MTPEIIFAFYAADMIGATLNLVDPRYSMEASVSTLKRWIPTC